MVRRKLAAAAATTILPIAAAAAVTLTAGPATAATHPNAGHIFNAPNYFNLSPQNGNGLYGMATQGLGHQVLIVNANQDSLSIFDTVAATAGYKIVNHSDHSRCLTQSGNELIQATCGQGNSTQWWFFDGSGPADVQNYSNDFAGVFNPNAQKPVWVEPNQSGYYILWAIG